MAEGALPDALSVVRRQRSIGVIESLHARLDREADDWKRARQELALAGGFTVVIPASRRKRGSSRSIIAPLVISRRATCTGLPASASTGCLGIRARSDTSELEDSLPWSERTPSSALRQAQSAPRCLGRVPSVKDIDKVLSPPLPFPTPKQECRRRLRLAVFNACKAGEVHPAAASCVAALMDTPWFLSRAADQMLGGTSGWDIGATLHTTWTPLVVAHLVRSDDIKRDCLSKGTSQINEKQETSQGCNERGIAANSDRFQDADANAPFDILLVPGGSASRDFKQLGSDGRRAIRDFVSRGGGYCGICAGAFLALKYSGEKSSLALVDATACMHDGRVRETLDADEFSKEGHEAARNEQSLDVRFTPLGRSLLWDESRTTLEEPLEHHKSTVRMRYSNGPQMVPQSNSAAVVLGTGWPVSSAKHSVHPSVAGSAAIIMQDFGHGRALLISPHAESTHESVGGSRAEPGRARMRRVLQRAVLLARAGHKDFRWLEEACHLRVTLCD